MCDFRGHKRAKMNPPGRYVFKIVLRDFRGRKRARMNQLGRYSQQKIGVGEFLGVVAHSNVGVYDRNYVFQVQEGKTRKAKVAGRKRRAKGTRKRRQDGERGT